MMNCGTNRRLKLTHADKWKEFISDLWYTGHAMQVNRIQVFYFIIFFEKGVLFDEI
jgi:hypothetical protein